MVTVPRLQQIQAAGGQVPRGERINVRVQDQSADILRRTGAIGSLAEKGADIYQKYENDKINQLSYEAENEYNSWSKSELQKLKSYEGDPTDAYAQYEKDEIEKYDEILSKRPGLNERVKRHLTSNLDKASDSQRIQALYQRGKQQEVYKNNLYESTVKTKRDYLPTSAGYIREDERGSYEDSTADFDKNIKEIKTVIAKRGLENGSATILPDDAKSWSHDYLDGDNNLIKVHMTDMAKERFAKERSEGVSNSINAVLASGQHDTAKFMIEKYKDVLDPKSHTVLLKRIKKEVKRTEAYSTVSDIESQPLDKQESKIERITDPEKKSEVLKIMATNTARRTALRKGREDRNFDALTRTMVEMKNNNQLHGVSDLESNPTYKATWGNLSAKQQKSIQEEFTAPKKSDEKVRGKVYDILLGNNPSFDIKTMNESQWREQLTGLNEVDKRSMNNKRFSILNKSDKSSRTLNRASKMLKTKLYAQELIKNDKYNKLRKEDFIKLNKANDDLVDAFDGAPENMTDKEVSIRVNEYVEGAKGDKLFGRGEGFWGSLFGSDDEPTVKETPITTKDNPLEGFSNKEIFRLQRAYKRKFKKSSPPSINDRAFLNYVRESK